MTLDQIDLALKALKEEKTKLFCREGELLSMRATILKDAAVVHEGDIVLDLDDTHILVTRVDTGFSKPWVWGNFRKKDGTWSKAERSLYNYWRQLHPTA